MRALTYREKAELALGKPLSRKHPVHHVDGNHFNNANRNLVICESAAYHLLLHVRQRRLRAGLDPSTKIVYRSISLPPDIFKKGLYRARVLGKTFSGYVQMLIERTLNEAKPKAA